MRVSVDVYAKETREAAEEDAAATREQAEQEARETIAAAEAQARRIVEAGTQRRGELEAVLSDLVRRRNEVLADTEELIAKLTGAVDAHRSEAPGDSSDQPEDPDSPAREVGGGADEEPGRDGAEDEPQLDGAEDEPQLDRVEHDQSTQETQVVDAESEQEART
jgi:hypothetical protein